jgi:hypothetical protein
VQAIVDQLSAHVTAVPRDSLQLETYIPPMTQAARNRFGRFNASPAAAAGEAAAAPSNSQSAPSEAAPAAAPNAAGYLAAAVAASMQVLRGLCMSFATTVARTLVHRSSLVLLVYVVFHAACNSLFFVGAPSFDTYVTTLHDSLLVRVFEAYLVVAGESTFVVFVPPPTLLRARPFCR